MLFVIDENLRAYQKIPLTSARASLLGPIDQVPTITLRKTDERRVIAHHPCHEYRGSQKTKIVKVSVSAFVSDDAPGTEELQSFAQRAILEFGGYNSDQKNNLIPGVVLEEQSIITVRTQDPLGMKRTTSSIVRTRVTDIQERELPAATFLPSDDYNEVKPPQPAFPAENCHPEGGDLRVEGSKHGSAVLAENLPKRVFWSFDTQLRLRYRIGLVRLRSVGDSLKSARRST